MDVIKYLVDHGADIHATDNDGESLLFIVSDKYSPDVIEYLVDQGIDIDRANHNGWTPLMVATNTYNMYNVKYFVEHGANIYLKNSDGNTAEDLTTSAEIIEYLQQIRFKNTPAYLFIQKLESNQPHKTELANVIEYLRPYFRRTRPTLSNTEFVQSVELLCQNDKAKRILSEALRDDRTFQGINIENYCLRPAATTADWYSQVPTAHRRGPISVSTMFDARATARELPPVALAELEPEGMYYTDVEGIRRHVPHMSGTEEPHHRISKRRGGNRRSRRSRRGTTQKKRRTHRRIRK